MQFLNTCFLPNDPGNDQLYEEKNVTNGEIFSTLLQHTEIFNDKNVMSFGNWCPSKIVAFLMCKPKMKRYTNNAMISFRSPYILKEEYFSKTGWKCVPRIQMRRINFFFWNFSRNREKDCSIPNWIPDRDSKFLEARIQKKVRRSRRPWNTDQIIESHVLTVKRTIVSRPCVCLLYSQANDSLAERDMKHKDELLAQLSVEGNTQGKQISVSLYPNLLIASFY